MHEGNLGVRVLTLTASIQCLTVTERGAQLHRKSTSTDNGESCLSVCLEPLLDLSAAFDTIEDEILTKSLGVSARASAGRCKGVHLHPHGFCF